MNEYKIYYIRKMHIIRERFILVTSRQCKSNFKLGLNVRRGVVELGMANSTLRN